MHCSAAEHIRKIGAKPGAFRASEVPLHHSSIKASSGTMSDSLTGIIQLFLAKKSRDSFPADDLIDPKTEPDFDPAAATSRRMTHWPYCIFIYDTH